MSSTNGWVLGLFLSVVLILILWLPAVAQSTPASATAGVSLAEDPNKGPSEFNHHVAGYGLIGVGLLVLISQISPRLRPLQVVWPFLFILSGLFLAVWSDAEIWPRGDLSWRWLLHHDAEAAQHKVYALLLVLMGVVEYLRVTARLNRFWRAWAFPLLAVFGVALLFFHDHTGGSQASTPEAQQYVMSWLQTAAAKVPSAPVDPVDPPAAPDHHMVARSSSEMNHAQMGANAHDGMVMDMPDHEHSHHMTASMLKVEHEHMWFALVGIAVILFKVIHDSGVWSRLYASHLWPGSIVLLGILLVLYTE